MARERDANRLGKGKGPRDAALPRDPRGNGRGDVLRQMAVQRGSRDLRDAEHGASNTGGEKPEGLPPVHMDPKPVNVFMPTTSEDLGIYRNMISKGLIKPYRLPDEMEKLAERVMEMMQLAQESGRLREAMKAAEILRMLAADNRDIALEIDRIDRLDAGKPTAIQGQVSAESQERIRRIVSVQRTVGNTEASHVGGHADGAGAASRPGMRGSEPAPEAGGRVDPARGDHAAPQEGLGARAQDPQGGQAE